MILDDEHIGSVTWFGARHPVNLILAITGFFAYIHGNDDPACRFSVAVFLM